MSKIIDITDKLNFEEKPVFKVKDVEITANNDAITILKVIALFENDSDSDGIKVGDILKVYYLLFDEENQRKVESLKLDLEDFERFVTETAQSIINSGEEDEGEAVTPATT